MLFPSEKPLWKKSLFIVTFVTNREESKQKTQHLAGCENGCGQSARGSQQVQIPLLALLHIRAHDGFVTIPSAIGIFCLLPVVIGFLEIQEAR